MHTDIALQSVEDFLILDRFSPTGVAPIESQPRVNAIATISGGRRGDDGRSIVRTTDGTIFVHGEAPGLEAALAERDYKSLTIMFPTDNPRDFIQQRFTEYTASALKSYGDENQITVVQGNNRTTYQAGMPEYNAAIKNCKVSVSVYFTLAEWTNEGADMIFPDGVGLYRLRFTSMNSLRSIHSAVRHLAHMTGGTVAGCPFELFMREEERTDGTGTKRRVWIWQCVTRPPQHIRLDARKFHAIMQNGQNQRAMLQLTAPAQETIEMAAVEGDEPDLDEAAISTLESGGLCDVEYWRKRWFATVQGSHLDDDEARHNFVAEFTSGNYASLGDYLKRANDAEANALIEAVKDEVETRVFCACKIEARYVIAASGNGWVCGHDPRQCNFRLKDAGAQPAPEPKPEEYRVWATVNQETGEVKRGPDATLTTPTPRVEVNGIDTESHAKKLAKDFKQDDGSVFETMTDDEVQQEFAADEAQSIDLVSEEALGSGDLVLATEELPAHIVDLVRDVSNAGFIVESATRPDAFLHKVVNPILTKRPKGKAKPTLVSLNFAEATWVRSAIAKGEVTPAVMEDATETVEGEVIENGEREGI